MTTRRSFLGSILALAAAPAIVRAESGVRARDAGQRVDCDSAAMVRPPTV